MSALYVGVREVTQRCAQGPQTGAEAPSTWIAENGFACLTKSEMGRSVAAQICFAKDAADAHKFALHSADQKQQGTPDGLVLRLFMSRIVADVQNGLLSASRGLSRERKGMRHIDDLGVREPQKRTRASLSSRITRARIQVCTRCLRCACGARSDPGVVDTAYLIEYLVPRMPERVARALPMHGPRAKAARLPPGWKAEVHPTTGKTFYRSIYDTIQLAVPTAPAVALGALV